MNDDFKNGINFKNVLDFYIKCEKTGEEQIEMCKKKLEQKVISFEEMKFYKELLKDTYEELKEIKSRIAFFSKKLNMED